MVVVITEYIRKFLARKVVIDGQNGVIHYKHCLVYSLLLKIYIFIAEIVSDSLTTYSSYV